MKLFPRFFSLVLLLIISNTVFAQGINFQGLARSSNGSIMASQKISLKLSIISGSANGNPEYVETREVTTNTQGIFSIVIGDSGRISNFGNFSNLNWKHLNKYLKVEMDPNGGNAFILMGVTQLQSVPFSYYSFGVDAANVAGILPLKSGGTGVGSIGEIKSSLFLDNVNNTADIDKPISNKVNSALDLKFNKADTIGLINRITARFPFVDTMNLSNRIDAKAPLNNPVFTGEIAGNLNGLSNNVKGVIAVSNGGTGSKLLTANNVLLGNDTGTLLTVAPSLNGNVLTSNGITWISAPIPPRDSFFLMDIIINGITVGRGSGHIGTNTALGNTALFKNTTGYNNTALGYQTLASNTSGVNNIAIGTNALKSAVNGYTNIAIGENSMMSADPGVNNSIVIGDFSGTKIAQQNNVVLGHYSLYNNTTGMWNTAVGMNTLAENIKGSWNVAVGMLSLQKNLGDNNTAVGDESLLNNTIGYNNSSVGQQSLYYNTKGNYNNSFGMYSLHSNTLGNENTGMGFQSLFSNTTGVSNTALGNNSLYSNVGGNYNIAIGNTAGGKLVTGDNNIFIGTNAANDPLFSNISNKLIVANTNTTIPLIYGEFDNKKVTINGDLTVTGKILNSRIDSIILALTRRVDSLTTVLVSKHINLNDSLVAYYPFTGNANDSSGYGNNGISYAATLTTDRFGNSNSAYSFDGSSYIQVPNANQINFGNKSFSISCWALCSGSSSFQHILTKGDVPYPTKEIYLRYDNDYLNFTSTLGATESGIYTRVLSLVPNKQDWHHIVVNYNVITASTSLYFDGSLIKQSPIISNLANTNGPMYFGVENPVISLPSGPQFYTGKLDEIRLYNRLLTDAEIVFLASH